MVTVTVTTTGKPAIKLDFPSKHPDQITVAQLKEGIHAKFPKVGSFFFANPPHTPTLINLDTHHHPHLLFLQLTIHRQRLTLPPTTTAKLPDGRPSKPVVLSEDTWSLGQYNIPDSGAVIKCKDLGMQLDWKGVFIAEYVRFLFDLPPRNVVMS